MDNKKLLTNRKMVVLIASICCILWGSAYPGVKSGYALFKIAQNDVFSELSFAGYRFAIAGIMVLIIPLIHGKNIFSLTKKNIGQVVMLGLTMTTFQYIFFYIGLANTTGIKGSIMNATSTFFSVILAHFLYADDKVDAKKAIGCLLGFIGVFIINFSSKLLNFNFNILGDGFIIMAAFIFSASSIYSKKLSETIDVILVTGYQLLIGGIFLIIIGTFNKGYITNFTLPSTMILLYLALLSAVAFSLWTLLLKYNKVSSISIFNFIIPISGAILSSIFLGERILDLKNAAALILVCIGIYIVNSNSK
ncbi:drug/metabolite transporter (DMT)-like permease [Clostridium algifaecis]|uniref:Drug/metabolite transporter (DMT)-like permease n=1 Tax=Clostridium algifaecis TaxID=1472040 RepID=A0ABS4KN97_9CLOT|nr:DMT family transporter [Clostridium algifaecis]MBP2031495.1 drug/metabolite transporter (DMT)-like permease [Clostridium algifaecis]